MNEHLEDRIRAALREQTDQITAASVRYPDLPRPRRRVGSSLVLAAVVAALLCGVFIGASITTRNSGSAAGPGDTSASVTGGVSVGDGALRIDGIAVLIPAGLHVEGPSAVQTGRRFCLTGQDPAGTADTTSCNGITLTIANSRADGSADVLPTDIPKMCTGEPQILTLTNDASIGGRPASQFRTQCNGQGPGAYYWQLTDSSLTISTPLGMFTDEANQIARNIDLTGWTHIK